jgi:formamidopyrimidine-DNA glycosylase
MAGKLQDQRIDSVGRRAKYLLFRLSSGETLLSHLGMTGSYRFEGFSFKSASRYFEPAKDAKHDHLRIVLEHPDHGALSLIYNDPRRFGFMALFNDDESPFLEGLGPEPLGNEFSATQMAIRFRGKLAPVKTALLDQRVVAGLGNIYASEALHHARLRPQTAAGKLVSRSGAPGPRLDRLASAIREVLLEAIEAGGSTLRDFRAADGGSGRFQHRFAVYDREGHPCLRPGCGGTVRRVILSGRSTYYCPVCQKR